ncbi:restriction endonuclease subunit S [Xanthomonas campestris]|uniref:restriction endonuclease subunit S n=1 Tax=Xanthomonas campestris TaxID=339 RepID=UPI0023684CFE|nr:restriction endonuclease subunit S [Xanthomonas campestris]WDK84239.1 restriction endonuclease subunit S [Xanthomonas campestris pv. campestris]WDK86212.1 restriction endonuclease subunit S [Xanthomonas campestris pv. campestris]WDK90354.1 restriction endonuclease subunit S [Xanthomonas campestris pv. campestris]WDL39420.1 restriction endonuclease subunit S [Xanthomonas campestris pv. campestris]
MLPKGWTQNALRENIRIHSGHAPGNLDLLPKGEIPYVKVEDLNNCDKYQSHSREYLESCRSVVPAQSLVFPKRGAAIFANKIRIAARPIALDTNLMAVEIVKGLDAEYLYYAISFAGLHQLADTSTIPQLNNKHVLPYVLPRPSLKEQRRIAHILSTWDQAIATIEGLLANACTQRKTFTNALFVHGRHSSMTTHGWKFADLDEVFERVTRRNTTANSNVLTISGTRGLVSQRDYFNKSVASENLSGYTLLQRGEFAYNKSYSAGYPMGAIKPLTRYDQGVVSSLYICFRLRDGVEADADFFRHYFEVGMLNEGLSEIAQEGARNHGLLNVGVGDFFKLRLHIPDVTEQRRVAAILNMAEQKEQLITAQLDKLRDEKKALMSQLLTGKRRVRLHADEAESA